MTSPETAGATERSLAQDWLHALRYWLRGRRGVAILVLSAVVVGAALNWNWLVAAGIAPLLLTALPCIAMCGLGLCMSRMTGRSCSTSSSASDGARTPAPDTVERLVASEPVEGAPASKLSKAGLVPEDLISAVEPAPEDPPHVKKERE